MKKLAVIGVGNMASAILGGMLRAELIFPDSLILFDRFPEKLTDFTNRGAVSASSIESAVNSADCVLFAIKPQNLDEVASALESVDLEGKLIITILAGVSTQLIEKKLGRTASIVRVMPNTPLAIGLGVTALAKNERVSDEDFAFARSIFESSGMVMPIDEELMNSVIAVNGSSPAYFYYFIDAMVKSARAQGFDSDCLVEAICRTVIGSAEMLMRSGKTPEELIRAVTSPKGTTERAMNELCSADVAATIDRAMRACTARAEEMARELDK